MKTISCFITAFALVLFLSETALAGVLIDTVEVNSTAVATMAKSADRKGDYTLSWRLKEPGRVTVLICDMKGNIVTTFMDKKRLEADDHSVDWDGRDDSGNLCPGGLYIPIIRVKSTDRGVETYNPTASPWGEEIIAESLEYDSSAQVIRYTLTENAFRRIRVGEKDGGPLYKTVADWKKLAPGTYEEPWDGMDTDKLITVHEKEKFQIAFDAFSVPKNMLMVAGPSSKAAAGNYQYYPVHPPHGKQLAYYVLLDHGLQPDLTISARFDSGTIKEKGKDEYHLTGSIPITIDLIQGTLGTHPPETVELYLYVDGLMLHEGPVPGLPAQVNLDSKGFSNGSHILTFNLRTSGDRAASTSMQVQINN